MTAFLTVALMGALLSWPARSPSVARAHRLGLGRPGTHVPRDQSDHQAPRVRRPMLLAAGLAATAVLLVGWPWWVAAAMAAAAWAATRSGRAPGPGNDEVPLVADLVGSCLLAGASMTEALAASQVAAGPWLRERTEVVLRALREGEPPDRAWAPWFCDDQLAPIARTCVRVSASGAAAAGELRRTAARLRERRRVQSQQRVARASVWVVLPMGLCFLPAFVLVGVVPLAIGLLHGLR